MGGIRRFWNRSLIFKIIENLADRTVTSAAIWTVQQVKCTWVRDYPNSKQCTVNLTVFSILPKSGRCIAQHIPVAPDQQRRAAGPNGQEYRGGVPDQQVNQQHK
jgi:hypothetical protein